MYKPVAFGCVLIKHKSGNTARAPHFACFQDAANLNECLRNSEGNINRSAP